MKKVTVLGNFSGRNAGDAAILGCLLKDVSAKYDNCEFHIPTINTGFVQRAFGQYNIKPIGLMPWNFSVKILGIPTWHACLTADLILVTDAILFDRRLYNPLWNYLWTLSKVLPMAKKKGIPIILFNSSLGPARTKAGQKALKRVIDSADILILRDKESTELLDKLGFEHPQIIEGADCALLADPVDDARFEEIKKKEDLFFSDRKQIGINVNSYVDAFVKDGDSFGRENLVKLYAKTVDTVIEKLDVDMTFVETQHMDMGIAGEVLEKIQRKDRVRLVTNKVYSYNEICSVLKRFDLFVGMRTHSLILSSAMGTVPSGIVTYPKNRGYMRTIGMEKNLIEFRDLSVENYVEKIVTTFENREELRKTLMPRITVEKAKAAAAADILEPYLR